MDVKFHYVQKAINVATVKIVHVESAKNPSDLLTKVLELPKLLALRKLVLLLVTNQSCYQQRVTKSLSLTAQVFYDVLLAFRQFIFLSYFFLLSLASVFTRLIGASSASTFLEFNKSTAMRNLETLPCYFRKTVLVPFITKPKMTF